MALDFVAGCIGGIAGILVGHPADTVKVRMQSQTPGNIRYHGTFNCFTQIIKKESVLGLYRGIMAPMYGQAALNAIIFGVYGNVSRRLVAADGLTREVIAGACAGFAQSIIVSPVELVKIRMQLQGSDEKFAKKHFSAKEPYKYSNPMDCLRKIYKHENGYRGIFRGYRATVMREVPGFAIYFGSFAFLCDKSGALDENNGSTIKLFFCGGTAGILSWVMTYPIDVIKTRLQSDGMGNTTYRGIIHAGQLIYKNEGFKAYFRGLVATILRAFPTNAATLTSVTLFLQFVEAGNMQKFKQFVSS